MLTQEPTLQTVDVTRRQIFPILGATAASTLVLPHSLGASPMDAHGKLPILQSRFVYVGTYTFPGTAPGGTHQSQAKGIYVFRMNPSDGGLTPLHLQPFIMAP